MAESDAPDSQTEATVRFKKDKEAQTALANTFRRRVYPSKITLPCSIPAVMALCGICPKIRMPLL